MPGWLLTLLEALLSLLEVKARVRRRQMGSAGPGNEGAAAEERAADSGTLKV